MTSLKLEERAHDKRFGRSAGLSPSGPNELRVLLRAQADERALGGERGAPRRPARRVSVVPVLRAPGGDTGLCPGWHRFVQRDERKRVPKPGLQDIALKLE